MEFADGKIVPKQKEKNKKKCSKICYMFFNTLEHLRKNELVSWSVPNLKRIGRSLHF